MLKKIAFIALLIPAHTFGAQPPLEFKPRWAQTHEYLLLRDNAETVAISMLNRGLASLYSPLEYNESDSIKTEQTNLRLFGTVFMLLQDIQDDMIAMKEQSNLIKEQNKLLLALLTAQNKTPSSPANPVASSADQAKRNMEAPTAADTATNAPQGATAAVKK